MLFCALLCYDSSFENNCHCVKSAHMRSFSGLHFLIFVLNRMRENTDQKNSEYGWFSRSEQLFPITLEKYFCACYHIKVVGYYCKIFFLFIEWFICLQQDSKTYTIKTLAYNDSRIPMIAIIPSYNLLLCIINLIVMVGIIKQLSAAS